MGTRCKASALPRWLGSLRLPHSPQPRRRNRLQTINQGVGPFYVVKANRALSEEIGRSEFSTDDRELGRLKLTPLGERAGAVELELVRGAGGAHSPPSGDAVRAAVRIAPAGFSGNDAGGRFISRMLHWKY